MAAHYDTSALPARPRRPRDKAKVEAAVRIVERWLLGKLRNRRFSSLAAVNAAIAELLVDLNDQRVMRYVGRTRRQLFEDIDVPRLKPLPAEPYTLAEWRVRKVGLDHHVDFDGHFYSVPYRHARAGVEVRAALRTIPWNTRPRCRGYAFKVVVDRLVISCRSPSALNTSQGSTMQPHHTVTSGRPAQVNADCALTS